MEINIYIIISALSLFCNLILILLFIKVNKKHSFNLPSMNTKSAKNNLFPTDAQTVQSSEQEEYYDLEINPLPSAGNNYSVPDTEILDENGFPVKGINDTEII